MTLRELKIGDRFYPKSKATKRTPIFTVRQDPEFNIGHGSATRVCLNEVTRHLENKSCRMEIIHVNRKTI